jgi:hypothetical protein
MYSRQTASVRAMLASITGRRCAASRADPAPAVAMAAICWKLSWMRVMIAATWRAPTTRSS